MFPLKPARPLYVCLLGLLAASAAMAQQSTEEPHSPIPVVTGFGGFQSNFSPGTQEVNPVFDPILLVPLGQKVLVESEFEMNLDVLRQDGKWGNAVVDHSIEYLQANYIANPYLTVTVGRFLTPFGIYRERLHPLWIRDLQAEPILFSLNATSSNGAMLRGAAHLTKSIDLTYATYYSAASTRKLVQSDKQAGFRSSIVLPNRRIEVGASHNHTMGDSRHNMLGTDFTWNLKRIPLDIRSEALTSKEMGKSYWVEGAYRLTKLGRNVLLRNTQVVFRQEQYWMPKDPVAAMNVMSGMGGLPDMNIKRSTGGVNYYLTPTIRLNAAYGGNYAPGENSHTWNAGLTYRFAIP